MKLSKWVPQASSLISLQKASGRQLQENGRMMTNIVGCVQISAQGQHTFNLRMNTLAGCIGRELCWESCDESPGTVVLAKLLMSKLNLGE